MIEEKLEIGETIFNATQIVSKSAKEVEAMIEHLSRCFGEKLVGNWNIRDFSEDDGAYDDKKDNTKWVRVGEVRNFGITLRRKKSVAVFGLPSNSLKRRK